MTDPGPADDSEAETNADQRERLAAAAEALTAELAEFNDDAGDQFSTLAAWAKRNRFLIWALLAVTTLGICISAVLGLAVYQVRTNEHQISVLTQRLNTSQTTTRKNTLCPLYTLLLSGDTPAARAAAKDKAAFDKSALVIRQGYIALNCQEFITAPLPSATPSP